MNHICEARLLKLQQWFPQKSEFTERSRTTKLDNAKSSDGTWPENREFQRLRLVSFES